MSDSALLEVNSRFLCIALQNAANSISVIGFVSCCFRSFSSTSSFASLSVMFRARNIATEIATGRPRIGWDQAVLRGVAHLKNFNEMVQYTTAKDEGG
jgi:hypothetical protein